MVRFLLSVDTEEEFDWGGRFPQEDCSVENIQCIPAFQEFCETIDIRPTVSGQTTQLLPSKGQI